MATTNDLYLGPDINNLELLDPLGRKFTTNNIQLSREDRTASGRLVRDIIATKAEFDLRYKLIDGASLNVYIALYELNTELVFRIARDGDDPLDYNVLMDPLSFTRLTARGDGLWEGCNVVLREI